MHEHEHHVLLALMGRLEQLVADRRVVGEQVGGLVDVTGVERVDPTFTVTDGDDLPAQAADGLDLVGLEITEHH